MRNVEIQDLTYSCLCERSEAIQGSSPCLRHELAGSESRSFLSSLQSHRTSRVLWLPLAFLFAGANKNMLRGFDSLTQDKQLSCSGAQKEKTPSSVFLFVRPEGIEPPSPVSKTGTLSVELRAQIWACRFHYKNIVSHETLLVTTRAYRELVKKQKIH